MKKHTILTDLHSIDSGAEQFLKLTRGTRHFAFYGTMGAGKTTFITALCLKLGALDLVSSPTFSIVNEYETTDNQIIYHFDFYRIKDSSELYDIGFEDYCNSDSWCFIEWPERAEDVIPDDFVKVFIHVLENNNREITFDL